MSKQISELYKYLINNEIADYPYGPVDYLVSYYIGKKFIKKYYYDNPNKTLLMNVNYFLIVASSIRFLDSRGLSPVQINAFEKEYEKISKDIFLVDRGFKCMPEEVELFAKNNKNILPKVWKKFFFSKTGLVIDGGRMFPKPDLKHIYELVEFFKDIKKI